MVPLRLDLTDEGGIRSAIDTILEADGRIDTLINNAGYGSLGPVETVPMEEARRQMEVNLFGLAALVKQVLPHMREQGSGHIINVSSIAGKMVIQMGGRGTTCPSSASRPSAMPCVWKPGPSASGAAMSRAISPVPGWLSCPDGVVPSQELRQAQWDSWEFTYDHVMLIFGKAVDQDGVPYYLVKNSWGRSGKYLGIWYISRDYIALNTTYIFLNCQALPRKLRRAVAS